MDLTEPGWAIRQGQAVWVAARHEVGVAGELLVGTHPDGSCWVQFAKPPFNLYTAQRAGNRWHIESEQGRRRRSGRGVPPSHLIWFQIARCLDGKSPDPGWEFSAGTNREWVLTQVETGQELKGYLLP